MLGLRIRLPRILTHTRRSFTANRADPTAVVTHRITTRKGRVDLMLTDCTWGLIGDLHVFGRSIQLTDVSHPFLFSYTVEPLFHFLEERHQQRMAELYAFEDGYWDHMRS